MMGEPKQPGAKTNIPSDGHPPDIQRIGDFFSYPGDIRWIASENLQDIQRTEYGFCLLVSPNLFHEKSLPNSSRSSSLSLPFSLLLSLPTLLTPADNSPPPYTSLSAPPYCKRQKG